MENKIRGLKQFLNYGPLAVVAARGSIFRNFLGPLNTSIMSEVEAMHSLKSDPDITPHFQPPTPPRSSSGCPRTREGSTPSGSPRN